MARPKAKAPALRYHLSGQSVVTLDGRDFYLGKHDTPESLARYAVLIAVYQQNECRLPESFTVEEMHSRADLILGMNHFPQHQEKQPVSVMHVTASYREFAKKRFATSPQELHRVGKLCDEIDSHEGKTQADEFGPLKLQEQRERWVKAGHSRSYVNRQTNLLVRIFKRAVSQELVLESVWHRLKSVEPLRQGQTTAPETEPIKPVPLEVVRATAKHLSPVLRDMVRVHVATGMRPSEVCMMRPCDIDRSSDVWMFRPKQHKTASKGKRKAVPIVGDAREVVENYLNRRSDSFCFSARESVAWQNVQKRAARKTKVQPSQMNRRKENPAKSPREHFDAQSYNQAIKRAAKKAGVAAWHPYQLRHLAGTVVRNVLGVEFAQALLGHCDLKMTERYTSEAEQKSIEAANVAPKL